MEEGSKCRLFIGGGQDYWGETADRDRQVVKLVASELYNSLGNSIEIVTGGMAGIPNDFALAWVQAGGKHVLCVVSSEHEATFLQTKPIGFNHIATGKSQTERRLAVTKLEGIKCALFIQGGKFSTHEMKLFEERQVPIVSHWGSGGAAGGQQPYEGYVYTREPMNPELSSVDPGLSPLYIAAALASDIKNIINK